MTLPPDARPVLRVLFVTWTPHHRATGLALALGAALDEPSPRSAFWPTPLRYLIRAVATALRVIRMRPRSIVFTDPPFVTGVLLLALRVALRFNLWADAHSGAFNDPRWARFGPIHRWMLRRCSGAIVASDAVGAMVRAAGARSLVLNYPWTDTRERKAAPDPPLVAILGYKFDEPVAELLEAARLIPHVPFVLPGAASAEIQAAAPNNCSFTGWLMRDEYEAVLAKARGVVCLTTREDTMQMGAYEAIQYGLPMVLTGTKALRALFRDGVIFVEDHDPATLAAACDALWRDHAELAGQLTESRVELLDQFAREIDVVRSAVSAPPLNAISAAG